MSSRVRGVTSALTIIGAALSFSMFAGSVVAQSQPPQGVSDATAPENLRCPGPNLPFDPTAQQLVYVWQTVVKYPQSLDDQGPKGVALDHGCNLYVADTETSHIIKVSPNGDTLATWGSDGTGPGQFHRPAAVALDADGNIYVADSGNNRIQKLSPTGQSIATWQYCSPGSNPCVPAPGQAPGQFFDPEGIAIDGQGNVYVSEVGNNRIQKLNRDGKSMAVFGGPQGSTAGQFNQPFGLALDRVGNLYVADLNNNRVQKLSPAGQALAVFGSGGGAGAGQLVQPRGVTVDAAGNVYVPDTQDHRVEEFAPDSTFKTQWRRCEDDPSVCQFPNSGSGPGEFFYPHATVMDAGGDLYVADTSNNRVQRLVQTVVPLPESTGSDE
ncbi:MAG: 6-bladed beta-propeller [Chloroflexi bacterium]|nr:6-bladed beta-propeller [Chloroflexota bacterium]